MTPSLPAAALPWPNVRGKRCLALGPVAGELGAVLRERGAAEVVVGAAAGATPFDVVVAHQLLAGADDPATELRAAHEATAGMFLCSEPIALWGSILGRGRPRTSTLGGVRANAAGHKALVASAGFAVERTSRPFLAPLTAGRPDAAAPPWRAPLDRLALRALTGSTGPGCLHRALLARAER